MKITIAANWSYGQTVIYELGEAIARLPSVERLTYGVENFWSGSPESDVLHLHWPESLFFWRVPGDSEMAALERRLLEWRARARIVVTAHNRLPHLDRSERSRSLYRKIYEAAHGVVHMGRRSLELFQEDYPDLKALEHSVIPHKIYTSFAATVGRSEARSRFGLPESELVCLCFGALRLPEETRLLVGGFWKAPARGKRLLVARAAPFASNSYLDFVLRRACALSGRILLRDEHYVPNEDMQYYFNSADLVILPRVAALNSGVLVLAFTFGKTVVGPADGVIGEILSASGNPTFHGSSQADLGQAIERGRELARAGQGAKNREYAERNWNDSIVAEAHLAFYRRLLAK